jgi:hypothetical protein
MAKQMRTRFMTAEGYGRRIPRQKKRVTFPEVTGMNPGRHMGEKPSWDLCAVLFRQHLTLLLLEKLAILIRISRTPERHDFGKL